MKPRLQHLEAPAEASFRCFVRSDRVFGFEWHYHHDYELTLITHGRGRYFIGDRVVDYQAPDLVLVGPDLPHTWHGPAAAKTSHRAIVVQFATAFIERFAGMPEFDAVRALLARSRRGLAFAGAPRTRAATAMEAMMRQPVVARLPSFIAILQRLADASTAAEIAGPGTGMISDPASERRIDQVFRYLADHLDAPISQAAVARQAGMTAAAFSRFFKRTTGQTFVAHVQEMRIARACERLIASDDAVTDVCFACGFANLSNFNRCFRRLKGVSPREFRAEFNPPTG